MSIPGLGDLDDLFQGAQDDGLTDNTLDLVVSNLNGPTMMQTVGVGLDDIASSEVTLAMNVIDMSGSMTSHAKNLTRAYNDDYLSAMRASPVADDILVSTILFDDQVELLHGYVSLDDAQVLTPAVYKPRGATALYDAIAGGLTNMVLYAQQLRQSGIAVRCIVLVYTDGEDNSSKQRAKDIKKTVEELYKQEIYTFALIGFTTAAQRPLGFNNAKNDPVRRMADELGFIDAMTAGLSPAELRHIFRMASMSTVQVSQGKPMQSAIFAP